MVTIDKLTEELANAAKVYGAETEKTARAVAKALGLEVNEKTREVYNPAEGSYRTTQPARTPNFGAPPMNRMRLKR